MQESRIEAKYTIYDNMPPLKKRHSHGAPKGKRGSKYPIEQLEVGKGFPVPLEEGQDLNQLAKTVRGSVGRLAKLFNYRVSVHMVSQEDSAFEDDKGNKSAYIDVRRLEGDYRGRQKAE